MNNRHFAKGISVSSNSRATRLNNNDVVIGVSGSGKTGSYVVPYIMTSEESFIVTDTKGNLFRRYKDYLKGRGYRVRNIDLIRPERGGGYDPLHFIGRAKRHGKLVYSEKDILTVASTLCPVQNSREPFWEHQAQEVLCCLISFVLEEFDEADRNLSTVSDVFRLMSTCIRSQKRVPFLEEHCVAHPDSLASRKYELMRGSFDADKTWGSTFMFVSTALDVFDFDTARDMVTSRDTLDFAELGRRKTALFLNVSDSDRSLDKLVSVFYTQAFQNLLREADSRPDSRLAVPVRIILDDFATNCQIPDFDKLISVIRSREISVSVILQSISQLEAAYSEPQKWTIINNCDDLLYLGGADLSTIYYVAERARRSPEDVMALDLDKAYFIQRGRSSAMLVNKLLPYAMEKELPMSSAEEKAREALAPQSLV